MNVGAIDILLDRRRPDCRWRGARHGRRVGATELVALGHNCGLARMSLGDGRDADLRHSVEIARASATEHAGLSQPRRGLWRSGRFAEAADGLDQAESYGRTDFPFTYTIDAQRLRLQAARGEWAEAKRAFARCATAPPPTPASWPRRARAGSACWCGGAPTAGRRWPRRPTRRPRRRWCGLPTGLARIEHAWLTGVPRSRVITRAALERTDRPGTHGTAPSCCATAAPGPPAEPFPGCPESEAAGLRGDWRRRRRLGAHRPTHERALELAESGSLADSKHLRRSPSALPAVAIVRERLRSRAFDSVRGHRSRQPWPTQPA
jgi:hypothetical protein